MTGTYTSRELFDAYNELMMLNGLEPYPEHFYRNTRTHMTALARWCAGQGIDPRGWILAKHEAIHWRFRISPKKLMATTTKFIEAFRSFGDMKQAATIDQIDMTGTAEQDTGGLLLAEVLKRTWVATPDVCRVAPETSYRSDSEWCGGCPQSVRCHVGS